MPKKGYFCEFCHCAYLNEEAAKNCEEKHVSLKGCRIAGAKWDNQVSLGNKVPPSVIYVEYKPENPLFVGSVAKAKYRREDN